MIVYKVCRKAKGRYYSAIVGNPWAENWLALKRFCRRYTKTRTVKRAWAFKTKRAAMEWIRLQDSEIRLELALFRAKCATTRHMAPALLKLGDLLAFTRRDGKPNGWASMRDCVHSTRDILYCRNLQIIKRVDAPEA